MSASAFLGPDFFANLASRTAASAPKPPATCTCGNLTCIWKDGICTRCGGAHPIAAPMSESPRPALGEPTHKAGAECRGIDHEVARVPLANQQQEPPLKGEGSMALDRHPDEACRDCGHRPQLTLHDDGSIRGENRGHPCTRPSGAGPVDPPRLWPRGRYFPKEGANIRPQKQPDRHVYREHVTSGLDCWCGPTYRLPCDECDTGCWKCDGGLIALDHEAAEKSLRAIVVIHNEKLA